MASDPATKPAVTHLRDYLATVWRHRWILITCVVTLVSTVTVGTFLQTPIYRATAKVLINREAPRVVSFQEVSPLDTGSEDYYQTQYEIIRSRPVVEKVIARLDLLGQRPVLARSHDPVKELLRHIVIEPIRNSRLVGIAAEDADPKMAADIANLLAKLYVEETVNTRVAAAREALNWLSDQLVDLKAKAADSEAALQSYKEKTGMVAPEEKQDLTLKKLEDFNSEYIAAKTKRLELEAQLVELRRAQKDSSQLDAAPVIVHDPLITKLRTDLIAFQVRLSELRSTYTEKHPEVIKIRSQIDKITREMAAEVARIVRSTETEYAALRAREDAMLAAVNQYKDEAQGLAGKQIQYGVLKREADTNQELYDLLLKRVKETRLEEGLRGSNVRIVEEAHVPHDPAKPNKPLNIGLGVLVSLLLGVGLVFFAEYMDDTVRTQRDVENLTGLAVVGMIPLDTPRTGGRTNAAPAAPSPATPEKGSGLAFFHDHRSLAREAFRGLRTHLLLLVQEGNLRHLLITSAGPGEGKTTVAANLAMATAHAGYRVLLVDADLHRPRLHDIYDLANDKGLADVLQDDSGRQLAAVIGELVRPSGVPNLQVLPAGGLPTEAAEIFAGNRMRDAIAAFGSSYDLVLYDSPPVLSLADPTVLAPLVDGVLLVVRAGQHPREAIRQAGTELAAVHAKMIGAVLNGVETGTGSTYYGHYNYRYPYYRE